MRALQHHHFDGGTVDDKIASSKRKSYGSADNCRSAMGSRISQIILVEKGGATERGRLHLLIQDLRKREWPPQYPAR